jgi:hypothetical protein
MENQDAELLQRLKKRGHELLAVAHRKHDDDIILMAKNLVLRIFQQAILAMLILPVR